MLVAQGPLRVSLFGGGSDLPAFLAHNDGAVLSFALDRRVFIVGHPLKHRHGVLLKYSETEDVESAGKLRHPIAREVLSRYGVRDMDIAVMSDVPAGTGLGSSSTFTVTFLAFVRHLVGAISTPSDLAREACEIEIDVLKEPIGLQDQWASALGGINVLTFVQRDVRVEMVGLGADQIAALEGNIKLVPVGRPRSASDLLQRQGSRLISGSRSESLTRRLVEQVDEGKAALLHDMDALGPLLEEAWRLKCEVAPAVTNPQVDELYELGMASGATGGKLLGAGGSGYFAFYVPAAQHARFASEMPKPLAYRISSQGASIIHES